MDIGSFDKKEFIKALISYLEKTNDNEWLMDKCRSKDHKKHCVMSHVFNFGGNFFWHLFEEMIATTYMIFPVNDGKNPKYNQETPKKRCISYLQAVLEGKEKTTYELMDEPIIKKEVN